jgi:phage-related protein
MIKKEKKIIWMGSSLKDLREFPEGVKDVFGVALFYAQRGSKHPQAKPLKGSEGASVLEVVEDYDKDTYRCMYTVKYGDRVYVLHAFQKKSKKGLATPHADLDVIDSRLKEVKRLEGVKS